MHLINESRQVATGFYIKIKNKKGMYKKNILLKENIIQIKIDTKVFVSGKLNSNVDFEEIDKTEFASHTRNKLE